MPADLEHHDRLGARGGAHARQQSARVVHAFDVEHDAVRVGVERQEVEDLRELDVDAGAGRDDRGEAEARRPGVVEQRRDDRPRLRHQRHRSRPRRRAREARVQADAGPHESEAVGTEHAHAAHTRACEQIVLQRLALRPALGEPCRQHEHVADAEVSGRVDQAGDGRRRRHDDREVGCLRQICEARVTAQAVELPVLGVDRVDGAREGARADVAEHRGAERAAALARAHHRERARSHGAAQVVLRREQGGAVLRHVGTDRGNATKPTPPDRART